MEYQQNTIELYTLAYGCIYEIKNHINNKKYIGITTNSLGRRCPWTEKSLCSTYQNPHLTRSFEKYGIDNFSRKEIDYAMNLKDLYKKEKYYIKKFKTQDPNFGYNIKEGGQGGPLPESVKKKVSKTRIKTGVAKGKKNPMFGKNHSEETKKKISQKNKENKAWNEGKNHSKETIEKIRKKAQGRILSEEHKKKISKGLIGHNVSEETIKKKTIFFIPKELLKYQYIHLKKSMTEIGRFFGCSRETIRKRLNKYNIPIRSHSEAMKAVRAK